MNLEREGGRGLLERADDWGNSNGNRATSTQESIRSRESRAMVTRFGNTLRRENLAFNSKGRRSLGSPVPKPAPTRNRRLDRRHLRRTSAYYRYKEYCRLPTVRRQHAQSIFVIHLIPYTNEMFIQSLGIFLSGSCVFFVRVLARQTSIGRGNPFARQG